MLSTIYYKRLNYNYQSSYLFRVYSKTTGYQWFKNVCLRLEIRFINNCFLKCLILNKQTTILILSNQTKRGTRNEYSICESQYS